MSIALDFILFSVPFTMLFASVLSVSMAICGCGWPISVRVVFMDVAFWECSNNPPNSASISDAMTFLIILHSTCTGPFSYGVDFIGMLDFGPRKNIHLLFFVTLVMRCRIQPSIYI